MADKPSNLHFVLVHGAGHGAWCWYKIRCLMETSGYKVTCFDLKGAGIVLSDPNTVFKFEDHNQPLIDFFSNLPENEKVGHSAGGLSVTYAIHNFAKKIYMAIYVAANMLKHGFRTDQDVKDAIPDLSEFGDVAELKYGLGPDQPPTSSIIKKEFQHKILYHMSPIEDSTLATMLLRPAPIRAFRGVQLIEGPDADGVPRVYIKTMHDRVVNSEQQDAMIRRWPPSEVFTVESDHSPFFSAHFVLFGFLVKAVASIR